jgi:hypothetical protein
MKLSGGQIGTQDPPREEAWSCLQGVIEALKD